MRPIGDRAVTVSDRDIADFYTEMSPYGYGDVETALEQFAEVGLSSEVLAEKIKEYCDETGYEAKDQDICAIAWDHILQEARNYISQVCNFDVCNNADFTVAGDYLATSFDYSTEGQKKLQEMINEADPEQVEKLFGNKYVKVFFHDTDITQPKGEDKIENTYSNADKAVNALMERID